MNGHRIKWSVVVAATFQMVVSCGTSHATIRSGGSPEDDVVSIGYDANTGEMFVDAGGHPLAAIQIRSESAIFTGDAAQNLGGPFDPDRDDEIAKVVFFESFGDISFGNVAQLGHIQGFISRDFTADGTFHQGNGVVRRINDIDLVYIPATLLLAGDANQDWEFDFEDLSLVLDAGKYETGQLATWGEGDWNGAPGGSLGNPPPLGDGLFSFDDILAALLVGHFEIGPYAATSQSQAVPEPSTTVLAVLGLLALLTFTHRRLP